MALSITDFKYVLSGGTTNTNPNASLGGNISTDSAGIMGSQLIGTPSMSGVTVIDGYGNATGYGTLGYTLSNNSLAWVPPGNTSSTGVIISGDGEYVLGDSSGYIVVDVTDASLPGADAYEFLTVAQQDNNLFDDVTDQQSFDGLVEYRCFYVKNNSSTDTAYNTTVWIDTQPPVSDGIKLALNGAGVAIGPLADEGDSTNLLSGLTFVDTCVDLATGLVIGTLAPAASYAVWIERTTPALNRFSILQNTFTLGLAATAT